MNLNNFLPMDLVTMFDPRIAFLISTPVFAATPNKETPWSKIFLLKRMFMKSRLEALRSETD